MRHHERAQEATFHIRYNILPDDGAAQDFIVELDAHTLNRVGLPMESPPEWARLNGCAGEACGLDHKSHQHCPVALSLVDVVDRFRELLSYTEVTVTVETPQRTFVKRTTVQRALSSLIGLLMATSECPGLSFLKPLARFHLPFATREETLFRVAGTYLLGQYLRQSQGKPADMQMEFLSKAYARLHAINLSLAERLRHVSGTDANVNALVLLDLLAQEFPPAIEEKMQEIAHLFEAYLKDTVPGR